MSVAPDAGAGRRARNPFRRRRHPQTGLRNAPLVWMLPAFLFALALHYIAVGAGAWYAFTDWNGVAAHAKFIGLANFREILRDPTARSALWHTLELAVAFVITVNAVGLALAIALNRSVKSRHFLRALFFAPVLMAPLAVSYVWQFIFYVEGPLNSMLSAVGLGSWQRPWLGSPTWALWTIFIVLVWQFAGLAMTFYLAGLQGIAEEVDEATAVDGASPLQRFRWVTLPLLAPAMTVSVTYTLVAGLRVFDQVMALTAGGPVGASETLATQVYKQTFVFGRFGYGAAFALVLTLVVTIVALAQLSLLRAREERL